VKGCVRCERKVCRTNSQRCNRRIHKESLATHGQP
jgi:hypothetical protein